MNAKRIELGLVMVGVSLALAAALVLSTGAGTSVGLRPHAGGGERGFSPQELADREAAPAPVPTRVEAERQRIIAIARGAGHTDEEAQAIAERLLQAEGALVVDR